MAAGDRRHARPARPGGLRVDRDCDGDRRRRSGAVGARRVKMTAMPQMVALFNGVGGGAVALIALAEFHNLGPEPGRLELNLSVAMIVSAIIGSISFAGSLIAFAKLQELIGGRPIVYPGQKVVNALVIATALGLAAADPRRGRVPVAARRRDRGLTGVRRPLRPADRRRRHARRHLAPERLHGARGLGGGLRAARERPDRQRRPRRSVGHPADAADGPGDEPLDHERPLRRVRADPVGNGHGTRRRAQRPRDDGGGRRDHALVRAPGGHRAGLRAGGRAGAARRPRARRISSRTRASTCGTRSTRSPAACRAT